MQLVQSLRHEWRVLVAELTKFGLIGVVNTVLDFAVFNALHFGLQVGPLTSKCVSTVISTTVSYFLNRHWTFRHRARTAMHREYVLFFLLNLVGLFIGLACIGLTHYGLHQTSVAALNAANFVGLVLGTLFRFWSYRRWVFVDDPGSGSGGAGRTVDLTEPADLPGAEPIVLRPEAERVGGQVNGQRLNGHAPVARPERPAPVSPDRPDQA